MDYDSLSYCVSVYLLSYFRYIFITFIHVYVYLYHIVNSFISDINDIDRRSRKTIFSVLIDESRFVSMRKHEYNYVT